VIKGYDLSGITVPSRHVAGDYYDFVLLNGGDSLALVVADVSGKGIPASLLTATLHAAIRSNEDAQKSPEAIISRVNALLHRSTSPEEFATLFYGVVDLSTGELRYANAGHDFPFLLWREGASMLSESGIVLGCLEQYPYLEAACGIPEGGVLVLYTDGLTDCESAKGENFGTERLRRVLEANVGGSAKEICRAVLDDVRLFSRGGESLDDMTMLVLKRYRAPDHSD
jgi:sigma-B regulation protein RsbU (phosphoserine phosphatase)